MVNSTSGRKTLSNAYIWQTYLEKKNSKESFYIIHIKYILKTHPCVYAFWSTLQSTQLDLYCLIHKQIIRCHENHFNQIIPLWILKERALQIWITPNRTFFTLIDLISPEQEQEINFLLFDSKLSLSNSATAFDSSCFLNDGKSALAESSYIWSLSFFLLVVLAQYKFIEYWRGECGRQIHSLLFHFLNIFCVLLIKLSAC